MTPINVKPHQRRSETVSISRDIRELVCVSDNGWSVPLWEHALPAWCGVARSREAVGFAELAWRQEAVRRWRGLPPASGE